MTIDDILIINWTAPGREWWDNVASKPDEPLIQARMILTLSHREYHELLGKNIRLSPEVAATSDTSVSNK